MTAKKRRTKRPADRPRTFEEVRATDLADPFHAARIARLESGERFDDPNGPSNDRWAREVFVLLIARAAAIGWLIGATATVVAT
jgi:hypothetical protein